MFDRKPGRDRRLTEPSFPGCPRTATLAAALLAALLTGLSTGSLALASGGPGALSALSPASVGAGSGVARMVVSPDGRSAYGANRFTTTVSQYARLSLIHISE